MIPMPKTFDVLMRRHWRAKAASEDAWQEYKRTKSPDEIHRSNRNLVRANRLRDAAIADLQARVEHAARDCRGQAAA